MAKSLMNTAAAAATVAAAAWAARRYGIFSGAGESSFLDGFRALRSQLGLWAIPAYVAAHTVSLAMCLPCTVAFEAGAAVLFGFLPAVACVFAAKVLGASLSFWIGRAFFRSSKSAREWAHSSKYFNLLSRGVERDGWKFVVLARFSPIPSYVINYALAATQVGFLVDFLLPTVIGCLPMILQNTSIGSLAGAAVASTTGTKKSHIYSYFFPIIGVLSSVIISLRIKKYASAILVTDEAKPSSSNTDASISKQAINQPRR